MNLLEQGIQRIENGLKKLLGEEDVFATGPCMARYFCPGPEGGDLSTIDDGHDTDPVEYAEGDIIYYLILCKKHSLMAHRTSVIPIPQEDLSI